MLQARELLKKIAPTNQRAVLKTLANETLVYKLSLSIKPMGGKKPMLKAREFTSFGLANERAVFKSLANETLVHKLSISIQPMGGQTLLYAAG